MLTIRPSYIFVVMINISECCFITRINFTQGTRKKYRQCNTDFTIWSVRLDHGILLLFLNKICQVYNKLPYKKICRNIVCALQNMLGKVKRIVMVELRNCKKEWRKELRSVSNKWIFHEIVVLLLLSSIGNWS